jgi:hypothetical protein
MVKPVPKSQLSMYISANVHKALRKYSDDSDTSMAKLVEEAIRELLLARTGKEVKR